MTVNVWGIVAIVIFYLVILVIGIVAGKIGRKRHGDQTESENAMVAGRSVGMVVGVFTMTATWVGGGYINGTSEMVYAAANEDGSGLIWVQAPFFFSISLIFGGLFFARKMREAGYLTMLDPITEKLGTGMGAVLCIPAILGDLFWSASILSALGTTLAVVLHIELWICIIISTVVAWLYTVLGGLFSVVYTDIVQLFCLVIGLVMAIPFAWYHPAVSDVAKTFDLGPKQGWKGYLEGVSWGLYIDFALEIAIGGIPWQVYFQRVLASKTVASAKVLSILGAVGCLIMSIPPILIGGIAYSTDWNQTDYADQVKNGTIDQRLALPLVLQYLTPTWVAVIGLGAISAAVMSSADSAMLSASTVFSNNIWKAVIRKAATDTELIWVMRGASLIFAVLAAVMAIFVNSIYGLFVLCADLVYVLLFPQLTLVLYTNWFNTYGSATGFFVSLLIRLLSGEYYLGFPAVLYWPWYDESINQQYFPHRTAALLIGLFFMITVSLLMKYLFTTDKIAMEYDFLRAFNRDLTAYHNEVAKDNPHESSQL